MVHARSLSCKHSVAVASRLIMNNESEWGRTKPTN
jgi:hypothetical protein